QTDLGFDLDPPAGPSQVGDDAGQRIETRQCGTAMALAGPRHHPHDAVLEDLPGQTLREAQDLVVELLERPDLARGIRHGSNLPQRPRHGTPRRARAAFCRSLEAPMSSKLPILAGGRCSLRPLHAAEEQPAMAVPLEDELVLIALVGADRAAER